jgi:CBS domain containing-hemolysin-like protein
VNGSHGFDFSDVLKLLGLFVLVLLNGFFVAAELAMVKIRATQLDTLVARGHRRAKVARHVIGNLDAYISATQLGITLASLGMGIVAEPIFHALLEPVFSWLKVESEQVQKTVSILVGFFVDTYLLVVAGEVVPKAIALRQTLPTALWTAQPLVWFYRLAYPFIWVLQNSALWLLQRMGFEETSEVTAHSEEELRLLLATSQKQSGATHFSRDIVLNALDLRHRIVREVMRPRQEIASLDTEAAIADCLSVAEKTRFSRFPLCEHGDLDRTLGVVHIKDLYAQRLKARSGAELAASARKLVYVPETARLEKLLQLFLERKLHFAIVVDEYGGTTGMVTLENILEELVGQEKPLLVKTGERTWDLRGALPLHDLSDLVRESLATESVATASGWVTQRLGGFPKTGDEVSVGSYRLRVEEMDGMRVARLTLTRTLDENTERPPG